MVESYALERLGLESAKTRGMGGKPRTGVVAWLAESTPTAAAAALDRIVLSQVGGLRAEVSGVLDEASVLLAGQAHELESCWGETRLALRGVSLLGDS